MISLTRLAGWLAGVILVTSASAEPTIPPGSISRADWGAAEARPGARRQTPRRLTLHHTEIPPPATPDGIAAHLRSIQETHQSEKKWEDIAYHVFIDPWGRVIEGRDAFTEGDSGTKYDLSDRVLVCLIGDFRQAMPPEVQGRRMVLTVAWLCRRFGIPFDEISLHQDLADTTCPGEKLIRWVKAGKLRAALDRLEEPAGSPPPPSPVSGGVPAQRLVEAYPDHLEKIRGNVIVWKDGTEMVLDDGRRKDHAARLLDADLEDQLSMAYTPGALDAPPPKDFEPGRIRHDPFFKKMYGASADEVEERMTTIRWLPGSVDRPLRVTTVNQVHRHLEAVSRELEALPPKLRRWVDEPAGVFNWRAIAGTDRLSPHSFAMAVDIDVDGSDYWHWVQPDDSRPIAYRNKIPQEIVDVFERHGFLWGGKWYHYDTMHFEYRPEFFPERR